MKGLATRTTKLGFHILRLHYSCDPDKDPDTPAGKKWYAEARRGMSDARFRQEYELDYGALGGQRVFPDFEETLHVVEPRFPINSDAMTVWLACDPHPRTAHAFLWAAVGKDGDIAVVWSSWRENAEKKLISEYAEMLHKADCHPFKLKPYRRIMDVAGKSFNADEERDIFQAYRDAKMRVEEGGKVVDKRIQVIFQPAKKDIGHVGLELINQALKPEPFVVGDNVVSRPRLTIWAKCGDNDELIYQLKSLRYREWRGNVTDKDAPEEPQDKRRHLVDCLKYIMLDRPRFVDRQSSEQEEQFNPNTVIAIGRRR